MRTLFDASDGFFALAGLLTALAPAAWAQPPSGSQTSSPSPPPSLGVVVGRDVVFLRDIARTGAPVDASPVAWRGEGSGLAIQYSRPKGRREHRFELSAGRAGHFEYETPLESIARPKGDSFTRIEGRYEYRRYVLTDLLVQGLDLGAGLQGGVSRWWLTRHFSDALETSESRASFGAALVVALRFHRGSRFNVELSWLNAGHLSRSSERHSADAAASRVRWGGGWLTDLGLGADIGIARRTSLFAHYLRTDGGLLSSHRNYTHGRRSLAVGVKYAK